MHPDILDYNQRQEPSDKAICDLLAETIERHLPEAESKVWHAHPVWFLDDNPIVGYKKLKHCVRLLFWSGQFDRWQFIARVARRDQFRIILKRDIETSRVIHLRYEQCIGQGEFISEDKWPVPADEFGGIESLMNPV